MPAANATFDTILTTSSYKYRRTLTDNIFRANPLLFWLQAAGRIDKQDGGHSLVVPLMGIKPAVAGSYAGYDAFTLGTDKIAGAQAAQLDAAQFAWQQYVGIVAIAGIEEAKNAGASQIIKLLDAKVRLTELTMAETMNQMLFLDGSGNTNKDWNGLASIVSTANPPAGAGGNAAAGLGGIDRVANTWWQAFVEATVEALTLSRMTTGYNSVSKGNEHPDLGLTTQTLFEKYEGLLQPQARYTDMRTADGGFQNLLFKGMTLMFDLYCQAGTLYFLNSGYFGLLGHSDTWFKSSPWIKRHDMDARFMSVLAYGNMVVSAPRFQGKLTGKS